MEETLLQHHIEETRGNFADVREDLRELKVSLAELKTFRTEMIVTSRTVSLVVSAVCGFITLVASVVAVTIGR